MRDFTPETLTDAVVKEYTSHIDDPRRQQIFAGIIRHLHAFVREVKLEPDEWMTAIGFLTDTGKKCDDKRQEFILLSDVLGVSMMVDAVNNPTTGVGTASTVLGPFFEEGVPDMPMGASIVRKDVGGIMALVTGRVTDAAGKPIAGAALEIWQTASNGLYSMQDPEAPEFQMRGRFHTDADGRYAFVTSKPISYSVPTDGPVGRLLRAAGRTSIRPAHVHFMVSAPGYRTLVTHIFADDDPHLDSDAVFAVKDSLVREFKPCSDAALGARYGIKGPFTTMDFDFGLMPA